MNGEEEEPQQELSEEEEDRNLSYMERRERNIAELKRKYLEIFGKERPEPGEKPWNLVIKPKPKPRKPRKPREMRMVNLVPTRRSKRLAKRSKINFDEQESESEPEERDAEDQPRRWQHLAIFNPDYYTNSITSLFDFNVNQPEEEDDFRGFTDEEIPNAVKYSSGHRAHVVPTLNPEDVTEAMLANICVSSGRKAYDKLNGTTCHQCRQKTMDTKTVCRSGRCVGIRGMFCGPCLKNRYGENVEDALKDKDWACPPCRDLCNCSICRTRQGQAPTGILAPYVAEKGYNSVKDYLKEVEDDEED